MRIAVVGSGIAGLASAWLLSRAHEVVLFEAQERLGGHTHTHEIELDGRRHVVDTGFIVHNREHYPLLTRLLGELGVATRPTTMSFSVQDQASGLEYNATSLDALFCQRRNLCSPRFVGMLRDLVRFYRQAPRLLEDDGEELLGQYLERNGYGAAFRDLHLVPMASALWSAPSAQVLRFPMRHLVRFMHNHQMLQVSGRPQWRVICGGSARYVSAMRSRWTVDVRLRCPVRAVRRDAEGVTLALNDGHARFDAVVMACHGDQALALLGDGAEPAERDILGAIAYQPNDVVLHTDMRLLPRHPKARAAWNAFVPAESGQACTVSYWMNLLQGLQTRRPLLVTLNRSDDIDPAKILRRMRYAHPVHTHAAVAAQSRRREIQGLRRTWYAGAYWGWGFHEDGVRSAVEVAAALGVPWATEVPPAPARDGAPAMRRVA